MKYSKSAERPLNRAERSRAMATRAVLDSALKRTKITVPQSVAVEMHKDIFGSCTDLTKNLKEAATWWPGYFEQWHKDSVSSEVRPKLKKLGQAILDEMAKDVKAAGHEI